MGVKLIELPLAAAPFDRANYNRVPHAFFTLLVITRTASLPPMRSQRDSCDTKKNDANA